YVDVETTISIAAVRVPTRVSSRVRIGDDTSLLRLLSRQQLTRFDNDAGIMATCSSGRNSNRSTGTLGVVRKGRDYEKPEKRCARLVGYSGYYRRRASPAPLCGNARHQSAVAVGLCTRRHRHRRRRW